MPPRSAPTARQRRVGVELRRLRERAGLTATEAAAVLGTERTKISNIETARFGVSAERLRAMACAYECADHQLIQALEAMTSTSSRARPWWADYQDILPLSFLDLAEMEHHARAIRIAHAMHIPGLLQTREYARAVFGEVVPALPASEVEHRLSHRLKRQGVLDRADPVSYTAYIHEAALRMTFAGLPAMRAQIAHLCEIGRREHVEIRIVTFDAGAYPGSGQTVAYNCGALPQLDTVQLDTSHGSEFVDSQAQLEKYRTLLDRMEAASLEPAASRDFMNGLLETMS